MSVELLLPREFIIDLQIGDSGYENTRDSVKKESGTSVMRCVPGTVVVELI